jgi:1,4-dihydroxy-2-naphthoate octaprenyltransferase
VKALPIALELLGIACLSVFAWFVWPPAALLVVGLASIVIGYVQDGGEKP